MCRAGRFGMKKITVDFDDHCKPVLEYQEIRFDTPIFDATTQHNC
jgi:hypothetical protein